MHNQLLVALIPGLAGAAAVSAAVLGVSSPLWRLPLLLAGVATALLALRSPRAGQALAWALRAVQNPRIQWAVLGLTAAALAARSFLHSDVPRPLTRDAAQSLPLDSPPLPPPIPLRKVSTARAVTDAGRPVRLMQPNRALLPELTRLVAAAEEAGIRAWGFSQQIIRLAPADASYNCHGWVFAGGRYWIDGPEVERILHDNGYTRVSNPSAGDLVVYRGDRGEVLHTGIVRADGDDDVLVESKWGGGGRFVHPLQRHYNGGRGEFYRSGREGHLLDGLDGDGA